MAKQKANETSRNLITMANAKLSLLAIIVMLIFSVTANATNIPTSLSRSTFDYIPVNIVNTQTVGTSSGLQVMLTFNSLEYQSYLATNLQNIYIFNGLATSASNAVIPAWIEGVNNAEYTPNLISSNTIIWINLGSNTIGASQSANGVYDIGIGTTNTNFFIPGNNIGIAPQLTCINPADTATGCTAGQYGEYDNGNVVFPIYYTNFIGSTLSGSWTCTSTCASVVANGLSVAFSGGEINNYLALSSNITSSGANTIVDELGSIPAVNDGSIHSSNGGFGIGVGSSSQPCPLFGLGSGCGGSSTVNKISQVFIFNSQQSTNYATSVNSIFSLIEDGSGGYFYTADNYTVCSCGAAGSGHIFQTYPIGFAYGYGTPTVSYTSQWIRVRINPPDMIMPDTSTGTIVNFMSFPTLSFSPSNSITYGTPYTITATCETGATCDIDYPTPGTHIATGTTTSTYSVSCSSAATCNAIGTYSNFYANDLTDSLISAGSNLVITQATPTLSWAAQCALYQAPFATPNPCTTTAQIATISNQLVMNLYQTGTLEGSSTATQNTVTYNLPTNGIGNYIFVANTLGNGNYIAGTETYTSTIAEPVYAENVLANGAISSLTVSTINSPFIWNTYYPIYIHTTSPSNTLNYSLSQTLGATTTVIATNALNLTYIPPANQVTGNYIYTITEREMQDNDIITYVLAANQLNMSDFGGALSFTLGVDNCATPIQYAENCALYPFAANTFNSKPSSWSIQSDKLSNQYSNLTGIFYNVEPFSNANLTFYPKITLNYPSPFGSFIANAVNNPGITTITQTVYQYTKTSTGVYTRLIISANTFDQQFFSALRTNSTTTFSGLYNNYNIPPNVTTTANSLNWKVYMPSSNYANGLMYLYNITLLSTAANHYAAINNFCPASLTSTQSVQYNPYLANLNASLYTFQIYQNSGYGATNYTMVVQTGTSPATAIQVQSYKIASVPFALPLENGQEYRFLFYNINCSLVYTSAFSVWPQTITINLPNNSSIGPFSNPQINASCYTYANTIREWVVCSGDDSTDIISNWNVNVTQSTFLSTLPINNYSFTGASFYLNWTVPNATNIYTIGIYALQYQPKLITNPLNYAVNNTSKLPISALGTALGILMLFFFLVTTLAANSDLRVAIILGLIAIVVGAAVGLNFITTVSFTVLAILGLVVIFMLRSKTGE